MTSTVATSTAPAPLTAFTLHPKLPDRTAASGDGWDTKPNQSRLGQWLAFKEGLRQGVGAKPTFDTHSVPANLDLTFGGRLRSQLYEHRYTEGGVARSVKVHLSVVPGDPNEPVEVYIPGLTTDSLHMFGHLAQDAQTRGTKVFFDPVGLGYSETPASLSAHRLKLTADALQGALAQLGLTPSIFVVQSYGYAPWLYLAMRGGLERSTVIAYATSPDQPGNKAAEFYFRHIHNFVRHRPNYQPADMVRFLYSSMPGVPADYSRVWFRRHTEGTVNADTGLPNNLLRSLEYLFTEASTDPDGFLGLGRALRSWRAATSVMHTVHLIAGGADTAVPPSSVKLHANGLANHPNISVTYSEVPGAGHLAVGQDASRAKLAQLIRAAAQSSKK